MFYKAGSTVTRQPRLTEISFSKLGLNKTKITKLALFLSGVSAKILSVGPIKIVCFILSRLSFDRL